MALPGIAALWNMLLWGSVEFGHRFRCGGSVHVFLCTGHLIFPLFSIALTVHLRLIPEAIIVIISAGSAVVTTVVVCAKGWEFRVVAFYLLSRNFYALFAIMLVR